MSDEHDSWFSNTFGVDLGGAAKRLEDEARAAAKRIEDEARAAKAQVTNIVQTVQKKVDGVIDDVVNTATGVVKKAAGVAGGGGAGGGAPKPAAKSGGGTGKFPLSGSVGNGGQNDPNDVKAVQRALGISDDGQCGNGTITAIENFQRSIGQAKPDGRVDAGGATERALASGKKPAPAAASGEGDSESLFDKAMKGAKGLADDLDELGGKIVKAAEATLDSPGAFLAHTGPLNSPSYVNNQNPPGGLQGGGTASAGDSQFVTGGDKGQLKQKVQGIYGAAKALNEIGTELEKKGAKKYWFDDEQLIQSGKNLHSTASAMVKLAKAIDDWTGAANTEALGKADKRLGYIDNVINAVDAVAAIRNLKVSTAEMEKKSSKESVDKWADSVGDAFEKAGGLIGLIPDGALPGFVVQYYKGLFSAPKNYIAAFKTMLNVHYGNIDKEAGLSGANQRAEDLGRTGLDWEGDLTGMFIGGYMLPRTKSQLEFQRYMLDHRKKEGVDLFKVNVAVGKGVMLAAIERDVNDEDEAKAKWIEYVGNCK